MRKSCMNVVASLGSSRARKSERNRAVERSFDSALPSSVRNHSKRACKASAPRYLEAESTTRPTGCEKKRAGQEPILTKDAECCSDGGRVLARGTIVMDVSVEGRSSPSLAADEVWPDANEQSNESPAGAEAATGGSGPTCAMLL